MIWEILHSTCIVNEVDILYRINESGVIKISDFGLTEQVYVQNYYRQGENSSVKLPLKWMALESIHKGIFSEKTDVVSKINSGIELY